MKVTNAVGKTWGPRPWLMCWAYQGIIIPMLSYGALIWAQKTSRHKKQLLKLQRLGLTSMGCFLRSTPTKGLEVLFDVQPLELRLKQMVALSQVRIRGRNPVRWDGIGSGHKRGHVFLNYKEAKSLGVDVTLDRVPITRAWNRVYEVYIVYPDEIHRTVGRSGLVIYTDGTRDGTRAGFGSSFTINDIQIRDMKGSMSSYSTAGQTEIMAILEAAKAAKAMTAAGEQILFLTDCKTVLQKLEKGIFKERIALECHEALTSLGEGCEVKIGWIQSHSGTTGNDIADSLAKQGAALPCIQETPMATLVANRLVSIKSREIWAKMWSTETTCRQTKLWLPMPTTAHIKSMISLDRRSLSQITQAVTGHNYLNYHQYVCGKRTEKVCRFCHISEETFHHVATECPTLDREVTELVKPGEGALERLKAALRLERVRRAMMPHEEQEDQQRDTTTQ